MILSHNSALEVPTFYAHTLLSTEREKKCLDQKRHFLQAVGLRINSTVPWVLTPAIFKLHFEYWCFFFLLLFCQSKIMKLPFNFQHYPLYWRLLIGRNVQICSWHGFTNSEFLFSMIYFCVHSFNFWTIQNGCSNKTKKRMSIFISDWFFNYQIHQMVSRIFCSNKSIIFSFIYLFLCTVRRFVVVSEFVKLFDEFERSSELRIGNWWNHFVKSSCDVKR